jgi:hypothetical protein
LAFLLWVKNPKKVNSVKRGGNGLGEGGGGGEATSKFAYPIGGAEILLSIKLGTVIVKSSSNMIRLTCCKSGESPISREEDQQTFHLTNHTHKHYNISPGRVSSREIETEKSYFLFRQEQPRKAYHFSKGITPRSLKDI